MENKRIYQVEDLGTGFIRIYYQTNDNQQGNVCVPKEINGRPIPQIDPYDKSTGNGCMVPNKIMYSFLSTHAKLLYIALRSHIYNNFGFTFVNRSTLKNDMSCTEKIVTKAAKELQYFKVIDFQTKCFGHVNKNYYIFLPDNEWQLPTEDDAKLYKASLPKHTNGRDKDKQKEQPKDDYSDYNPEDDLC